MKRYIILFASIALSLAILMLGLLTRCSSRALVINSSPMPVAKLNKGVKL